MNAISGTLKQIGKTMMNRTLASYQIGFACLVGLLCVASTAGAATYHVSLNGTDANIGSLQSPWRTINFAASRVAAGDTVIVAPGRYNETVSPNVSGTSGNPITFYGGGAATNTHW